MRVAILTISDSVAAGKSQDRSGASVAARCRELGWEIVSSGVRSDDRPAIEAFLKDTADSNQVDIILTTGGTGLGPRDVTPEATAAVVTRQVPGLAELMRQTGVQKTRNAALSRAIAGVRGECLIINLPGSPRGAVESFDAVAELLPHAVAVLHGVRHD